MAYVYLIGSTDTDLVKIGRAIDPKKRLQGCQTGSPLPLVLLWKQPVEDASLAESTLHEYFREKHVRGEWYSLGPDPISEIQKAFSICFPHAREEEEVIESSLVQENIWEGFCAAWAKLSPEAQVKFARQVLQTKEYKMSKHRPSSTPDFQ